MWIELNESNIEEANAPGAVTLIGPMDGENHPKVIGWLPAGEKSVAWRVGAVKEMPLGVPLYVLVGCSAGPESDPKALFAVASVEDAKFARSAEIAA